MSITFIKVDPIGLPRQNGVREHFVGVPRDFTGASRVSRNLFGSPEKGEINLKLQEQQRHQIEALGRNYGIFINDNGNLSVAVDNPVSIVQTQDTISIDSAVESRLKETSLIDKERREYEMKQNQHIKKIGSALSCDESQVAATPERIRIRSLKQQQQKSDEIIGGERPKPYARQQQAPITDFFSQRKFVVRFSNNPIPEAHLLEESDDLLTHPIQQHVGTTENNSTTSAFESSTSSSASSLSSHSLLSSSTHQSQEEISLHTMSTDHTAKLA